MKKIPRDIGATGVHHLTIPNHTPIKLGKFSAILNGVAFYHQKTKEQVVDELF